MSELYNTESPIDRKRRNNINATWDDILSRFANLQRQINILAGGQEVDELIARLEQAIKSAEIDVQNLFKLMSLYSRLLMKITTLYKQLYKLYLKH